MTEQETLYAIALSFVPRLNLLNRKMLIEKAAPPQQFSRTAVTLGTSSPNPIPPPKKPWP